MVELTHGGMWVRWSSMERTDKIWFTISCTAAVCPAALAGLPLFDEFYHAGLRIGSGGKMSDRLGIGHFIESPLYRTALLIALAMVVLSAIAWWQFSIKQDEMFNRVQNRALGLGSAWSVGVAACWWFLASAGVVTPLVTGNFLLIAYILIGTFWFAAVRRWA